MKIGKQFLHAALFSMGAFFSAAFLGGSHDVALGMSAGAVAMPSISALFYMMGRD